MSESADGTPSSPEREVLATVVELEEAVWNHFEEDRLGAGAEWIRPRSREQLDALLKIAYRASLRHEEARPVRFQLCYEDPPQQLTARFSPPIPLGVSQLVSLSPAIGARRRWLMVAPEGATSDALQLVGLTDPVLTPHPDAESVLTRWGGTVNLADVSGLTVAVLGPGWMRVSTSAQRLFELGDGRLLRAYTVHEVPCVMNWYRELSERFAPRATSVGRSLLRRIWAAVLTQVRDAHHGGTFLLLPDGASVESLPIRFAWALDEGRVREAILRRLELEPELSQHVRGRADLGPESLDDAHFLERDLARAERLLFALSQVDGAVALRRDLTILGFGGEITHLETGGPTATVSVVDPSRGEATTRSVATFGMRHRSALRFCQNVPGAIAFVVSQDGDVRIFVNEDGDVKLHDGATPEDWVLG